MTYNDPRDPYNNQPPQTQAYSQPNDYAQGYDDQYAQTPAPARPSARRRGPDLDPLMFCGGVLMTGVVTGLAAWLVAWVMQAIVQKINDSGQFGVWNPLAQSELWFALAGFVAALVGGAFWYLLQVGTPAPDKFYGWIVGLLIAAAVLLPLLLSAQISSGIGTAIVHLVIGLPILTLIPTMGRSSHKKQ